MTDLYLLYENDARSRHRSYYFEQDIVKDLCLDYILHTMSSGDEPMYERALRVMMTPICDENVIIYRHEVIKDLVKNSSLSKSLYEKSVEHGSKLRKYKENMKLYRARSHRAASENIERYTYMKDAIADLIDVRDMLEKNADGLSSKGLLSLRERLKAEPLEELRDVVERINVFIRGGEIDFTFRIGGGLKLENVGIREVRRTGDRPVRPQKGLLKSISDSLKRNVMSTENNSSLKGDVTTLNDTALDRIMKLMNPFMDDAVRFFEHLSEEMSFYEGVRRLLSRMEELGFESCYPGSCSMHSQSFEFSGLYDLSMAISQHRKPVGNDACMSGVRCVIITGANQGGKSTFLKSYGIAQILMQCGCPVPAKVFNVPFFSRIFTHFTRRENEKLTTGRLSEELSRMKKMVSVTDNTSLYLLNESFASTTEAEGAEIAKNILRAFCEKGVTTFMVTHLYVLAEDLYHKDAADNNGYMFFKAERLSDGTRTYRMIPGEPEATSYGMDLFNELL